MILRWLRSMFDKDHAVDREDVRQKVNHALSAATKETEASRKARRKFELELEARRRAR